MTPQERAEKIFVEILGLIGFARIQSKLIIDPIAAQISEACAEAYKSGCNTHLATCAEQFNEGWNAAREKAIRIFNEGVDQGWYKQIADRISRMEP